MLLDLSADQALAGRNPDATVEPASLTKLMTAYLVFQALRSARMAERIFAAQATAEGHKHALLARSVMAGSAAGAVSLFFFDGLSFPQSAGAVMMMFGLAGASLRLARDNTTTTEPAPPVTD